MLSEHSSRLAPLSSFERRALRLLIAAMLTIHAAGIWWGLPGLPASWAPDEFSPLSVHEALQRRFSSGWFELYPPVHVYVLAIALAPVELLAAFDLLAFTSPPVYTAAFVIMRLVSVAMAAGVVLAVFSLGRELFDARTGLFAALAAGLMAPFVFYAKLANVEVPYLLWLSLSLLFYVRVLARQQMRDYVALAAAAALAIGTKDQAYGFYILMPLAMAASDAALRRREGAPAAVWRSLINGRMLAAAGVGAAGLAILHNLLFNWSGAVERVRIMTGPITQHLQEFPDSVAGHAGMLALAYRHVQFSFGWPLFVAALAGVVLVARTPRRHARALALLLPIAGYWLFLIVPIMYHYDRYLLGVALILCVFAGVALAAFAGAQRVPVVVRGICLAAIAGYSILYAASVDLQMIQDGRYAAERWIRQNIPRDARVMAVGHDTYLPRFGDVGVVRTVRPTLGELAAVAPAYVVTTSVFDVWRFRNDPDALAFFQHLRAGRTPYEVAFDGRGRPAFNLVNIEGVRTNLDKINPRIRIYRRLSPGPLLP